MNTFDHLSLIAARNGLPLPKGEGWGEGEQATRFQRRAKLRCPLSSAGSGGFLLLLLLAPGCHRRFAVFRRNILRMRRHAPEVPERIIELAVTIPPEHVRRRHQA